MENNNRTSGSDRTPASKFEELLKKPIKSADDYFDYVKALYDEWHDRDVNNYPAFNKLNTDMKILGRDLPPQFFTGDIKSSVVMISLNGHSGGQRSEIDATTHCDTWEEYKKYWINFVMKRYGDNSKYKDNPVSKFDAKLHHFLSGSNAEVASEDLAKWNFFHMELCPFLSSSYPVVKVSAYNKLTNYLLRLLEVVALYKREQVIVLNRQVCQFLDRFTPEKRHTKKSEYINKDLQVIKNNERSFHLTKKCNEKTRFKAKRIDYTVKLKNLGEKTLNIVAVPTFASQGMAGDLLVEYNQEVFSVKERKILVAAIGIK